MEFTQNFPRSRIILTPCMSVQQPKFMKEIPETSAYLLNAVNTAVLTEKTNSFCQLILHSCLQLIRLRPNKK